MKRLLNIIQEERRSKVGVMMNNKAMVVYLKGNVEVEKKVNFLTKAGIVKELFGKRCWQFNDEDHDEYRINEGIDFVHFKNVTFYRDVKFFGSDETNLVFENCKFRGGRIWFIGGAVELINPELDPVYAVNRIDVINNKDFSLSLREGACNRVQVVARSKRFSLTGQSRVISVSVRDSDYIELNNVSLMRSLSLKGKEILIRDSNLELDVEYSSGIVIEAARVNLVNSGLVTGTDLVVNSPVVMMDDTSVLEAGGDIILGNDVFKNCNLGEDLVVTRDRVFNQSRESRLIRDEISILKGIRDLCEEKIRLGKMEREVLLKSEDKGCGQDKYNIKVKVRAKRYEEGMRKYKRVSQYFDD